MMEEILERIFEAKRQSMKDRETINRLRGKETEDWIVGWVNKTDVYVLDKENYEKESNHKYSDEEYFRLIKHELAHSFFRLFLNSKTNLIGYGKELQYMLLKSLQTISGLQQ